MIPDVKYHLHHTHNCWDQSIPPLVTVQSGDVVELETREASAGQLNPGSTSDALRSLDFSAVNPVTGPIAIDGAKPGDVVEVEILDVRPKDWGWTGVIPGFGLLADEYPEPYLKIWELNGDHAYFKPGIRIPLEPFCGMIGVAPAEPGALDMVPPRANGGNLDTRQLVKGSKVYLPVLYPGALLSLGDTHAAQGDGEVCGSAIEGPMVVKIRVNLLKDADLSSISYYTPGNQAPKQNQKGYYATTAYGPDLFEAVRQSIRGMIKHLTKNYDLTPHEAYALCSVAVDVRIGEVVNAPNWLVSAQLPLDIFEG
ncbi:acetamidase/formamidase [Thermosporothrix hazakensis]|jgi:acetamidase/formamidase|uniref:Acetamidase/formamidase n=2 Tax=Thermosporothrix TaxID=768650 RepID=A0A326U913_THEHA|nr:acetamidase/formamidase family protein [Thermosporothrix hazakensis]PZW31136.1 acetamidase/formamidase [Thermosporothrix hazakensis]BBH86642.1 acetamidase [Thermosporothrix sp. COM3]GCE50952.1 acetamidase [Thermosporothrix hazakensis]